MTATGFAWIYIIGLFVAGGIRARYTRSQRQNREGAEAWGNALEATLMALWGIVQLLPLVYVFTGWLAFADLPLPLWAGWLGVVALLSGIWMMWRSHADLGTNWSAGLQTSDAQSLVTTGVYARVRHPMYTAHWLLGIGQALLVHNWLAGAAGLVVFGLMYAVRVPREEAMMVDRFGAAYQLYQRKTGRVLPWF